MTTIRKLTLHELDCVQCSIAALLGLPYEQVRKAFDDAGYEADGRFGPTLKEHTKEVLEKLTSLTWQWVRESDGDLIRVIESSWGIVSDGIHARAFARGVIEDAQEGLLFEYSPLNQYMYRLLIPKERENT